MAAKSGRLTNRAHRIVVDEVVENMPSANIRRLAATSRRLLSHAVNGCSADSSQHSPTWQQPGVNRPSSPPVVIAGSALRVPATRTSPVPWLALFAGETEAVTIRCDLGWRFSCSSMCRHELGYPVEIDLAAVVTFAF